MANEKIAIGIDLGTTNSVMARMNKKDTRVLENQDSDYLTPSIVHITPGGEIVVGKTARSYGGKDPENTVYSIKRFMGRDFREDVIQQDIRRVPYKVVEAENGEVEVILRGKRYSPPQVSSFILASMKRDAEAVTDQEVSHAVITVPAYFGNRQKEATREAGKLAGLNVLRIIPEPTAAALAYGYDSGMEEPKTVLVYDGGGGTVDVTVMFIAAGVFDDLGKTGDMHLGGDDFDNLIMDWVIEQVRMEQRVDLRSVSNVNEVMYTLKKHAEEAKIKLARTQRASIIIPGLVKTAGRTVDVECELSRAQLDSMIRPLVDRSISLVHEAIQKASITADEVQAILLVGGSTKVPLVQDSLRKVFGEKVIQGNVNPMHCVAQGAAIQTVLPPEEPSTTPGPQERERIHGDQGTPPTPPPSKPKIECPECGELNDSERVTCLRCNAQLHPDIKLLNKLSPPIGLQVEGDRMEIILDESTYYPMKEAVTRIFRTIRPGQERMRLPIYQGFDATASKNQLLGEAVGELPAGLPENTEVAVSLSIDADGILTVAASLPSQPGNLLEAHMAWGHHKPNGGGGGGEGGGNGGGGGGGGGGLFNDWRDDANEYLTRAGLILEETKGFLPDNLTEPLREVGGQLLQAMEVNDQVNGPSLVEKFKPMVNNLGVFVDLGFARFLISKPEITAALGTQLADQLTFALEKADRYKRAHDPNNLVQTIRQEIGPLIEQALKTLSEQEVLGNINMGELLRGSSTAGFGR